jgi:prepilin signal peptidase PulO-like enzyme (type II secretory pathway)
MTLFAALFFVLGAIIASFVGVVAARLGTGQSIAFGRSRCDACDRPLNILSLVPIVSVVVSKGRALCCGARISWMSPVTEILLGTLFAASYLSLGLTPALPFLLAALSLLLALVLYDLAHQILPPILLYPFVALAAAAGYLSSPSLADFEQTAVIAICIGFGFLAIHVLSRGRAMGLADAPLAFGLALLVGPVALSGLIYSFWIGAVIGIALLLKRPAGSRMGVEVPFAPFLFAGFLLAYFTQWNLFILIAGSL